MEDHDAPQGDEQLRAETAPEEVDEMAVSDDSKRNPALTTSERRRKERHRAIPLAQERRRFSADGIEIRSADKAGNIVELIGTPIVYNSPYTVRDIFGEFEETMAPGVAADTLARGADVRFLFDHSGVPLGRSKAGTLTLTDGDRGLQSSVKLDLRSQLANDIMVAVDRGDLDQMSVGFIVGSDDWSDDGEQRTINSFADMLDVSVVTYPASPTTSIEVAQRMAAVIDNRHREEIARTAFYFRQLRAGKTLSSANQDKLLSAVGTLHDVLSGAGVDLSQIDPDQDGDDDEAEPDANVSDDATTGGNDTAETGVGADGFPADQTRTAEPGEPIAFHRKAALDQAWLDGLVEDGKGQHGSARKRVA